MSDFMNNLNKVGMILQAGGGSLAGRDGMAVVREYQAQQEDERRRAAIAGLLQQSGIGGVQRGLIEQLPVGEQAPVILNMLAQMEAQRRAGGAAGAADARRAAEEAAMMQALQAFQGGGQQAAPQAASPYNTGVAADFIAPRAEPLSFGTASPDLRFNAVSAGPVTMPSDMRSVEAGMLRRGSPEIVGSMMPPTPQAPLEAPSSALSFGSAATPAPRSQMTPFDIARADMENLMSPRALALRGLPGSPTFKAWELAMSDAERRAEFFAPPETEMFDPDRYRVVGNTLYDLADLDENGRPRAVATGQGDQEVIFGPDGQPIIARGPAGADFRFTEAQGKDNVYATRAEGALALLDSVGAEAMADRGAIIADSVPFGLARGLQPETFQVAQQAGNEFLQAILRKDTGAAITADEQALYGQTFLPQPGDQPQVLEAKRQARIRALEALKSGMNIQQLTVTQRALIQAAERAGQPSTGYADTPIVGGKVQPPATAIEILRSNPSPEYRQYFDEVFGEGAAARALGQ